MAAFLAGVFRERFSEMVCDGTFYIWAIGMGTGAAASLLTVDEFGCLVMVLDRYLSFYCDC